MSSTKMLPDEFGKKIGGSKRDLWAARGLILSDLDGMNDAEKDKYVKKNNIWKTPDYAEMYKTGRYDREVLYFIKKVKDKAATSPRHKSTDTFDANASYVEELTEFRDKVMSITTWTQCQDLLAWIKNTDRLTGSGWRRTVSEKFGNIGGADIVNAIYRMTLPLIRTDIAKKEFMYSEEESFAKRFIIYRKASGETQSVRDDYSMMPVAGGAVGVGLSIDELNKIPVGNYILMGCDRKVISSGTEEEVKETMHKLFEASKAVQKTENASSDKGRKGKKKFKIPFSVENCKRLKDGEDISLKKDVTPEQMLTAFAFHGGEFGNWLNNDTRQMNLTRAYEAFTDLAIALGISQSDISFGGRLSIAFGARGSGNAAAHYEPMREVINLTKFSGAGSLAHEYGHALDDIMAKKSGLKKPFTEAAGIGSSKAMKELLHTMKFKKETVTETQEETDKKRKRAAENLCRIIREEFRTRDAKGRCAVNEWYKKNIISATAEKIGSRDNTWKYATGLLSSLEELKKTVIPRSRKLKNDFTNSFRAYASQYFDFKCFPPEPKQVRVLTDFYKGSCKFDEIFQRDSHGYWQSDIEMFARCFSCYIKDKLTEMGIEDDYLCGSSDIFTFNIGEEVYRAYPVGDERKAINKAMEDFLNERIGNEKLKADDNTVAC